MAQGQTFQYDPSQVAFNVGGQDTTGFAEGTFIKVARNKEAFTTVVGSDGEVTRVKSVDLSGTITVTLQQSSPSNDYFSSLATADERTSTGAIPLYMKDSNGTTVVKCKVGWVKKKPDSEFSNTNSTREWIFETGNLQYDVGGETQIG
jgi:hypothetical protein